jgi:hypothetical protein
VIHCHIRWSNTKLDWERFLTDEEAQSRASELVQPGESYTIEAFDSNCPQCDELVSRWESIAQDDRDWRRVEEQ